MKKTKSKRFSRVQVARKKRRRKRLKSLRTSMKRKSWLTIASRLT